MIHLFLILILLFISRGFKLISFDPNLIAGRDAAGKFFPFFEVVFRRTKSSCGF